MQQNIPYFILTQNQEQLLMRVTLMMYLNKSILRLYQTYKNDLQKVQDGLLIQQSVTLATF